MEKDRELLRYLHCNCICRVVAIGVTTQINRTELEFIATGDNGENIFAVDSFDNLTEILQGLVRVSSSND